MEIKSKIFKRKSGKSEGKWAVRIEYFDHQIGRKVTHEKLFPATKGQRAPVEAKRYIEKRSREIEQSFGQILDGDRMTFNVLADRCGKLFYQKAVIVDGRKIEGVRSHATAQNYLNRLKRYFGDRQLRSITTETLSEYRRWRLRQGSQHPGALRVPDRVPIKLATVNRELAMLRRIMRYAFHQGWVLKDIFAGAKVIDTSAELERNRVLTPSEEDRLLDACSGERQVIYERNRFGRTEKITANVSVNNPFLRAMILLAIDAGMRKGEILKLRWSDIDFHADMIRIIGTHTKTERERIAPLTERVKAELRSIKELSHERPFPFTDFKRSWETAKRIAGIDDLRFHDLRRTAITRWQRYGLPLALAGKIAGHSQLQTTMKYYSGADADVVKEFANQLNQVHERQSATGLIEVSEKLN